MLEALKILEHAVLDSAAGGCSTDVRESIDSLAGTEVMKLRNHPLLNSLWPPVWTEKYAARKLTGEIGTLAHVGNNSRLSMLYLHITHEGLPYWGALRIKDSASRSAIYALLQE